MSLAAKAVKAGKLSSIYLIGSIIPPIVGIFTMPFFTRMLSTEQMGVVQVSVPFIAFLNILLQLGLFSGLKRIYFHTEPAERASLVRSVQIGQWVQGTLFSIVLSLAALPWVDYVIPKTLPLSYELRAMLWLMIVWGGYAGAIVRVGGGVAQLQERPWPYLLMHMTTLFVGVILGVIFVLVIGDSGFFRQFGAFLGIVAGGAVASWYLWIKGSGRFILSHFFRAFRSGLTFVPHAVAGVLVTFASTWMVADMDSAGAAGLYGIAASFAALIAMPLQAIGHALYPMLAGMMRDGTDEAKHQHVRFYLLIIAGTIFLGLGLSLFAPVMIRLLTAPEYHEAAYINAILVVAWMFQGFYLTVSQPVFFFGGGWYMTAATFGSLVVLLVMSKVLIPLYGAYGGAMAMAGCFMSKLAISAFCSHRLYTLKWDMPALIKLLLAAGVLGVLDFFFVDPLPIWYSVPIKVVLALAYIPLVIWSGIVSLGEARWGFNQARAKVRSLLGRNSNEIDD